MFDNQVDLYYFILIQSGKKKLDKVMHIFNMLYIMTLHIEYLNHFSLFELIHLFELPIVLYGIIV